FISLYGRHPISAANLPEGAVSPVNPSVLRITRNPWAVSSKGIWRSGAEQVVDAPNRRQLLDRDNYPAYRAYLLLNRFSVSAGQCYVAPSQTNSGRENLEPLAGRNRTMHRSLFRACGIHSASKLAFRGSMRH